jgi:hypothetical protein
VTVSPGSTIHTNSHIAARFVHKFVHKLGGVTALIHTGRFKPAEIRIRTIGLILLHHMATREGMGLWSATACHVSAATVGTRRRQSYGLDTDHRQLVSVCIALSGR